MVTLPEMLHLSPFDEEAFIEFEALCRDKLERGLNSTGQNESDWPHQREYMSRVGAAADELNIEGASRLQASYETGYSQNDFDDFNQAVFRIVTRLQLRALRRTVKASVEVEPADKLKIKFQVNKLKDLVGSSVLDDDRKKAVAKKLDELLKEIDGPRLDLAKLMVILASAVAMMKTGQSFLIDAPEMMVSIMDTVSMVTDKEHQRQALIEQYRKPRAIEDKTEKSRPAAKPAPVPREEFSADLDDEIPF
jgi:hypothetical protein